MKELKFSYNESLVPSKDLLEYLREQKSDPARFVRLPFDKEQLKIVQRAVKECQSSKIGSVIVVGIGGSNLGALAVWKALRGKQELCFAETFDARRLDRILSHLSHPAVVAIISKSGTTAETVANAAVILDHLNKEDKVAVITDKDSKLWNWAKKRNFEILEIPQDVVGRYSVFSAVGLFPLAMAGINIEDLLAGAMEVTDACFSENAKENPALASALAIFENFKSGKAIHDTFIFEPDLEWVGKWYRQLVGESLGKDGTGMTPTVSIGTTDLHSVAQLYLGGPKDKFTTFISIKNHGKDFSIPTKSGADELVEDISGKKFGVLLDAVLAGVKKAYQKQNLPFAEIELADLSERTLGAFLQMKMMEVVYLAKLMGVNAFDNPAVELYKEETRKLLRNL